MRTAGPAPAGRCSPSKRPIPGELNAYHLATLRSHGADRSDELHQAKLSLTAIIPICWYENTSGSFLISSLASLRALVGVEAQTSMYLIFPASRLQLKLTL